MSLYQKIKSDQLQARKARDSVAISLLTTLMGEAAMPGKNDGNRESTDAEVTATIKKFIKNIDSLPSAAVTDASKAERLILEGYLPRQLSEAELKETISTVVALGSMSGPMKMGDIMKILKETLDGQYDGAMASRLIKEALA